MTDENQTTELEKELEEDFKFTNLKRPPKLEIKECIECQITSEFPKYSVFCPECTKKVCMKCGVILSKRYKCEGKGCDQYHGQPSTEMPTFYCAECIILITQ